ncbi:hypothetical protein C8F04DRAFT_1346197 [Mycena alexandri]|uniref:Uncharacterized protein n=1 Tax=Mycena alexandri TaxID=1745969 RepID=A0AAD6SVR5_9AGAR|nr:hypothetical protein C8F04DRAFT_1346197 [Mycena alexandri]
MLHTAHGRAQSAGTTAVNGMSCRRRGGLDWGVESGGMLTSGTRGEARTKSGVSSVISRKVDFGDALGSRLTSVRTQRAASDRTWRVVHITKREGKPFWRELKTFETFYVSLLTTAGHIRPKVGPEVRIQGHICWLQGRASLEGESSVLNGDIVVRAKARSQSHCDFTRFLSSYTQVLIPSRSVDMFKPKPASGKPKASESLLQSHPDASKENYDTSPPLKRQRRNSHSQPPSSSFLNPFARRDLPAFQPDPTLPPNSYVQLPEDQMQYGYTPKLSPTQLEALERLGTSPENLEEFSAPSTSMTTPSSAPAETSPAIDPTLDSPASAEFPASIFLSHPRHTSVEKPKSALTPLMTPFQIASQPEHNSAPPILATATRPAAHIPKAITDRLNDQETRIRTLEQHIAHDTDIISTLERIKSELDADIQDLDGENHQMFIHMQEQDERLEEQQAMIDSLFAAVQELQQGQGEVIHAKSGTKKKESRDNPWNLASRRAFYTAMGLPSTSKVKDAAIPPVKKCGGFVKDPETKTGQLLRPDWTASFSENSNWHPRMVTYMRQKVPSHNPAITKEIMQAKSDQDILDRLEAIFSNVRTEYRKTAKGSSGEAKDAGEGEDDGEVVDSKQANRRQGRKVRKCDERMMALNSRNITLQPPFGFFLQARYQSTDESDDEDVIDPDTENENEVPAQATRKPWISRAPTYRTDEFQDGVLEIDKLVFKLRDLYSKDNRGKTPAHPRIRGPPKDVPLPFVGANNDNKIARSAISPEWLASHPDNDTPSRIQQEAVEVEVPEAADAGDVD